MLRTLILLSALAILTGCASQSLYYWGDYEDALYSHYDNPGQVQDYRQSLKDVIVDARNENRPVPPSIYAEYAYVLMRAGHPNAAIRYYKLEKRHWPESTKLMNKMIKTARHAQGGSGSNKAESSK